MYVSSFDMPHFVTNLIVAIIFCMYATNNEPSLIINICFYYNLEMFQMFEILESETKR